jgi:hypothetical protein
VAHVLVGEPASTSPEHALTASPEHALTAALAADLPILRDG